MIARLVPKFWVGAMLMMVMGCSTVQGPDISREEVNESTKELEVKAFEHNMAQVQRINVIGNNLLNAVELEDVKVKTRPYTGLYIVPRNKVTNRYYNKRPNMGVYIGFVLDNTPASRAGLQSGDILTALGSESIEDNQAALKVMRNPKGLAGMKAGEEIHLTIERDGQPQAVSLVLEERLADVTFSLTNHEVVNAWATDSHIVITAGMLNFVKNDEELAAVLGHEMGHIIRGHLKRKTAAVITNSVVALTLGVTADVFAPGTGSLVQLGSESLGEMAGLKFSRDLEREADYFGTKIYCRAGYDPQFAANFQERFSIEIPKTLTASYFNSHPNSPERKLRISKTVEEVMGEANTAK